jgi:DNA invertase Pin-like site-specific DNA recombinase
VKAYSYIRWSSETQTKGDSLTRQLEATRKICKERGWQLDESLTPDKGVSAYAGTNLEKGSLGAFLERVKSGSIATPCILVVEALDRLTRTRLRDARKLFDGLLERKVSICTAHNGKVYDEASLENPLDLIISLMELNAAHQYSATIGRRVSAAWTRKKQAAAEHKEILTSRTPAWIILDKETKRFMVDKKKSDVIRRIFNEYERNQGVFTIARDLNKDGIKPFGWGGSWGSTVIRRFLGSPSVIGQYQPYKYVSANRKIPDGPPIEDYYPAIISRAQFFRAQEQQKARFTPHGPRRNVLTLFTGLVKCARCGASMVLKSGAVTLKRRNPWLSLVCANALRGKGCVYRTMRYEPFERAILTVLLSLILEDTHAPASNAQIEALRAELSDVQRQIERANKLITNEDGVPKSVLKTISSLEKREEALKAQIQSVPEVGLDDESATVYEDIYHGRKEPIAMTIENRLRMRGVVSRFIDRIELDAEKRVATLYYPWLHPLPCNEGKKVPITCSLAWEKGDEDGFIYQGSWRHYDDDIVWRR